MDNLVTEPFFTSRERANSFRLFSDNSSPTSPLLTPNSFIKAEKISLVSKRASKISGKESQSNPHFASLLSPSVANLRRQSLRRGDSDGLLTIRPPDIHVKNPSRKSVIQPQTKLRVPQTNINFLSKSDGASELPPLKKSLRYSRASIYGAQSYQHRSSLSSQKFSFFGHGNRTSVQADDFGSFSKPHFWISNHHDNSNWQTNGDWTHATKHHASQHTNHGTRNPNAPLRRRHSSNLSTSDSYLESIHRDSIRYLDQSGETRASVKDSVISKSGSAVSSLLNTSSTSEDIFLFPKINSRESLIQRSELHSAISPNSSFNKTSSGHFQQQVKVGYLSNHFIREMKRKRMKRRRTRSHIHDQVKPIERFRKVALCVRLLLRCLTDYRLIEIISQASQMPFPIFSRTIRAPSGESNALVFNRDDFKPNNERIVDEQLKRILTLYPDARSNKDIEFACKRLRVITEEFGEFPKRMQEALVRVSWMDEFESKRVIIRQGQPADNFYYIIQGTAVATKTRISKNTGELYSETVSILKRGMSFGELAIVRQGMRNSNVVSNSNITLLTVGRSDFIDIFMHRMEGNVPEFVAFLQKLPEFSEFPMHKIPRNNPQICAFTYFRHGIVICNECGVNDMIVIIKSGFCKVVKKLKSSKSKRILFDRRMNKTTSNNGGTKTPTLAGPKLKPFPERLKGRRKKTLFLDKAHITDIVKKHEDWKSSHPMNTETLKLMTEDEDGLALTFEEAKTSAMNQHLDVPHERLSGYYSPDVQNCIEPESSTDAEDQSLGDKSIVLPNVDVVRDDEDDIFIHVQTLGEKDVFGLLPVIFDASEGATPMSLISEGAECILLNKEFYTKHLDDELRDKLMMTLEPYPTEEALQHSLQQHFNWDVYKQSVLRSYLPGIQ